MNSSGNLTFWCTTEQPRASWSDVEDEADEEMGEELYEVSPGLVALLSILYGLIAVVTVVGNALVILVIVRNRSMQTVTNFFIANLSVADEMIGIFSIPFQFQAALTQRWDLPAFLCPVAPFVKEVSVSVSIMTLVVISVDRYFAVIHPLKPLFSASMAKVTMSFIWSFSVAMGVPSAIAFRIIWITNDEPEQVMMEWGDEYSGDVVPGAPAAATLKPFCAPQFLRLFDVDMGCVYRLLMAVAQYFLPLIVITYAYVRIMHRVWFSKAPGTAMDSRDQVLNRNKRKVSTRITKKLKTNYGPK